MLHSGPNRAPCSVLHRGRMKGFWRAKALKQSEKARIKDTRVSFTLYLEPFVALTYPSLHVSQHRPSPHLHLSYASCPYSLAGCFNEFLTNIKYSQYTDSGYQEELNEIVHSKLSHDNICMLRKEMFILMTARTWTQVHILRTVQPQPQKGVLSYAAWLCGVCKFPLWLHWLSSSCHGFPPRSENS